MKNQMIFAILVGFMLFVSPALADCQAPANDTTIIINTTDSICTDTYSNVSIVIDNNNGILDLNSSVFIGDQTGVGISINAQSNQYIHSGYFSNYEVGIQLTDTNNTDFSELDLSDMTMYGVETYRSTYCDFSAFQIFNSSTGVRFNDNSDFNTIVSTSYFEDNANYGIVFADSNNNLINTAEITGSLYGISIQGSDNLISENQIYENTYGVDIVNNSMNNNITENYIYDIITQGIWLEGGNITGTQIISNNITNSGYAIWLENTNDFTVIDDNDISNMTSDCIQLQQGSNLSVTFNRIDSCGYYGINFDQNLNSTVSNNTISNTGLDGGGYSCIFSYNAVATLVNNIIQNNVMTVCNDYGILETCDSFFGGSPAVNFIGNIIYDTNMTGIWSAYCNYDIYTGNVISNNTEGINLYNSVNNTLTSNIVCDNSLYDIYDDANDSFYSANLCDVSDPNGLCEHPCGYVPPVPSGVVWPLTSTIFILITILVTVALGNEFAKDTSRYEILATILAFVTVMGIAISVVS